MIRPRPQKKILDMPLYKWKGDQFQDDNNEKSLKKINENFINLL